MAMDLRPLTLAELLDRAINLYRTHFRTLVAIMAPPAACGAGLGILVELLGPLFEATSGPEAFSSGALLAAGVVIVALFVLMVAYFVAYAVAAGVTTAAVSEAYLGRPATAAAAYRQVRSRIGALLLVLLHVMLRMLGVVLIGMLIAFPVALGAGVFFRMMWPGIAPWLAGLTGVAMFAVVILLTMFVALRYALAFAAVVLEPVTASQAIRRSVELTRGSFGRVLLLFIFAGVIAYITAFLFQGPFLVAAAVAGPGTTPALWLSIAGAAAGALSGAISGPIMVVALGLLYYDARVRQEGLDLQLMMQSLDMGAPSTDGRAAPAVLPR